METRKQFSKIEPHGINERRLFNTAVLKELLEKKFSINLSATVDKNGVIYFDVLCQMAFEKGVTKEGFKECFELSTKKMFANNFLWKLLKKKFDVDLKIPFITGIWTKGAIADNLVVNTGHAGYAGQIGGVTTTPFTALAYGTGTNAAGASDTALQTEVARGAATVTRVTTSTTNDTCQWVKTFTAGGTQAITEEGIFDNNTSGGNLLARQVFSAVNMVLNDTIQFTHKIQS